MGKVSNATNNELDEHSSMEIVATPTKNQVSEARLAEVISNGTMADIVQTPSQLMSQSTGGSMYTPEHKILNKAEIMSLPQMMALSQETICLTVVKTVRCADKHPTDTQIWKYRIDVVVEYGNCETTFTFWDRECEEILRESVAFLCDQMLALGIDDPLDYPTNIDTVEGRNLATRVKWQPKWSNEFVQGVHEGKSFIETLKAQFTPAQLHTNKLTELVTSAQPDDFNLETDDVIPTASLSDDTDQLDPTLCATKTPSKRTGASIKYDNVEAADLISSKLYSTKMPKHPKMEQLKLIFCN
ncbi:hypothetical protein TSUD_392270 [Trifolium subterraneum]|uniref:Replication factor A C-terminal domain-containing protein n=1 Tax=Trifolium subterraneum TaxID=3900 RepID=A0A2Z6MD81_TRISU|nr:hypothetical protein TSUD_392270 [Trifolium subterraneum]